jgi:uncharacterized cupredoxin-like copper-binding protein
MRIVALAAVLLSLAAPCAAAADLVVVRLVENRFEPAELVLEHGKAYRLRLENAGHDHHEFKAAAFFKAARVLTPSVLVQDGSEVALEAGKSADVELVAPAAGTYELTCPDHDWDGMVGKIVVR